MKRILLSTVLLFAALSLFAQQNDKFQPKKGSHSWGININPVAAAAFDFQPKSGEFVGGYINSIAENPAQMFMISPSSLLSVRFKYFTSDKTAFKASVGFSGSYIKYKEYVLDDAAAKLDAKSQQQVVDQLLSKVNGLSVTLGFESNVGSGPLKFTFGGSLGYAIGGGKLDFAYGNELNSENKTPTTMPFTRPDASLNQYKTGERKMGIIQARPVTRYNMGACQSLGVMLDMGVEWFFIDRLSLAGNVSIIPVLCNFQPQTYSIYEGYSSISSSVVQDNVLVSPGSIAFTYGLANLGINLSLNYWF